MLQLKVRLTLDAPHEGGRPSPIPDRFIANIYANEKHSAAQVRMSGIDSMGPGEEAVVEMLVPVPEHLGQPAVVGAVFEVREVVRRIGSMTIIEPPVVLPDP